MALQQITDNICTYEKSFIVWQDADFGRCFQQIVIISPAYLLLTFIGIFLCIKAECQSTDSRPLRRMWIVLLRLLAHFIIIGCQVGLLIEQFLSSRSPQAFTIVVESLILIAWLSSLCAVMLWKNGWHSVAFGRDFNALKIAWTIILISCSFELYSAILYTSGRKSPLQEEPFPVYESINIYLRWVASFFILILQIPRSNYQNLPHPLLINDDQEAGSSRGNLYQAGEISEHCFSIISRASFHWVTLLFSKARDSPFPSIGDLPFYLPPSMNPTENHCKLKVALNRLHQPLLQQSDPHCNYSELSQPLLESSGKLDQNTVERFTLLKSLNKAFGWSFWPLNLIKLVSAVLEISTPIILNLFLQDLESGSDSLTSAIIYLSLLVLILVLNSFIGTHLSYEVNKLQIIMKGTIITELYSKVLNVNLSGLKNFSVGELTNFACQDSDRISCHLVCFFEIWYMPLKLGIIFYLLYRYIGLAFLSGIGFCILLIPLNQIIAKRLHDYNQRLLEYRDKRMKLVHEVITNMKSIKLFSWEEKIIEKITVMRNIEIQELQKIANFDALCVYFWASAPCLITFVIMLTYFLLGNELSASSVFTTLALVDQVILPLNALPWVIMGFINAWVSLKRVQNFFNTEENSPEKAAVCLPFEVQNVIEVDNCSFYWSDPTDCCLVGLQFQVNKGELMVVMGKTGSGKSSLLLALSQELNIASGELRLKEWKDGAGIVLPDSWIKDGTVRQTIIDGSLYDPDWYKRVVYACALEKDIANFPQNDDTPVGVNGSALSGGQKIRLSLARAVYKNKHVYLIDDIFAGLDSNVALHIFQHCINGLLIAKTRVICTHRKQFASSADSLLILENRQIKYIGLPQMFNIPDMETMQPRESKEDNENKDEVEKDRPQHEEARQYGPVKVRVYKQYTKAAGLFLTTVVLLSLFGMQGTKSLSNWWLSVWIKAVAANPAVLLKAFKDFALTVSVEHPKSIILPNIYSSRSASFIPTTNISSELSFGIDKQESNVNGTFYLTVYGSLIAANSVFTIIRAFSFAFFGISATKALHSSMLQNVLRTAMHFFDRTPVGVVLNRFSSDIYSVDSSLPFMLNILLAQLFSLIATLVMTSYGLPYIVLVIIPLLVLYHLIQKYYITAVREVKRLYAQAQSPLFTHFEQTVSGLVYIHSFRNVYSVQNMGIKFLEAFQRTCFCMTAATAWLRLRLQLLAAAVVFVASVIILTEIHYHVADAAVLGLALTYALTINSTLAGLIEAMTEVEKEFVGAERVLQYTYELPIEVDKEDIQLVDYSWPMRGEVKFNKVSVRYKGCESRALNEVSFFVKSGEKVAIVGRTGAGKSSLLLALFRLVDIETGIIVVDDENIHDISSKVLRQKIAALPQEPLIFSGTVRENIDPFNKYSDKDITTALMKCQLSEFVKDEGLLDQEISLKTLSSGESQLFSLARILLEKSKILCLDEATSNVDTDTDQVIQKVIREEFKDSTIITIAHRIETVMDYDRVLVMSRGQIIEEGNPTNLVESKNSFFRSLAVNSGYACLPNDDGAGASSSMSFEH